MLFANGCILQGLKGKYLLFRVDGKALVVALYITLTNTSLRSIFSAAPNEKVNSAYTELLFKFVDYKHCNNFLRGGEFVQSIH